MKKSLANHSGIMSAVIMSVLFLCGLPTSAQEPGDSTISIVNNWKVGDYAVYRNYSGRIRIEGRDTITEYESPETFTKVVLAEVLPDDDKVFVITTQYADSIQSDGSVAEKPMSKENDDEASEDGASSSMPFDREGLNAQFMKLAEIPVTILTDFSGEVKDIYNYESLRAEMDSCFEQFLDKIRLAGMAEDLEQALTGNMKRFWDQSVSKEALMARCDLFRYYGYNYLIGTNVEHARLPLLTGGEEVDATVTFSCQTVETEDGTQLIEITSITSYDSDQVMDSIMSSVIGRKIESLREPERPFISMSVTEQFLFEPVTGSVEAYTMQKRTTSPEKTIIEYTAAEWE